MDQIPGDRLDARYRDLLGHRDLAELEQERWPAYGMWLDSALAYLNPAYVRQMPPRWGLGARVLDATGILCGAVERVHALACATKEPATMRYACPTASHAREFELRVFPLALPSGDVGGLLAIHSMVDEQLHDDTRPADEHAYRDRAGIIHQCAHCRRTRRSGDVEIWDVVPAYIDTLPVDTSHGICGRCVAHYYGAIPLE